MRLKGTWQSEYAAWKRTDLSQLERCSKFLILRRRMVIVPELVLLVGRRFICEG